MSRRRGAPAKGDSSSRSDQRREGLRESGAFEVAESGVTQNATAPSGEVRQVLAHRHRIAPRRPVRDDITLKGRRIADCTARAP